MKRHGQGTKEIMKKHFSSLASALEAFGHSSEVRYSSLRATLK